MSGRVAPSPPPDGRAVAVPGQVEEGEGGALASSPGGGSSPGRSPGAGASKKKKTRQKAEEARLRLAELQGRLQGLNAAEVWLCPSSLLYYSQA